MLNNNTVETIRDKALWMRRTAFGMVHAAQLGHPGGDFSAIDVMATLYFGVMKVDPKQPNRADRVRLGVWVLIFLSIFTVIAWRLNAAFWKDVK